MLGFMHKAKAAKGACTHAGALPRWDNVDDAGDAQKMSRLYCPDCDQFIAVGTQPATIGG
jgi:hypothetical protein